MKIKAIVQVYADAVQLVISSQECSGRIKVTGAALGALKNGQSIDIDIAAASQPAPVTQEAETSEPPPAEGAGSEPAPPESQATKLAVEFLRCSRKEANARMRDLKVSSPHVHDEVMTELARLRGLAT